MSSTSADQVERFGAFFDKLVAASRSTNAAYFPMRPDASVSTYYRTREVDAANYTAEFDGSQLAEALRTRWSERLELLQLIPGLVALFETSAGEDGEDGGEVSPFIYEMF